MLNNKFILLFMFIVITACAESEVIDNNEEVLENETGDQIMSSDKVYSYQKWKLIQLKHILQSFQQIKEI